MKMYTGRTHRFIAYGSKDRVKLTETFPFFNSITSVIKDAMFNLLRCRTTFFHKSDINARSQTH
jgi:hypothetical protein